jgi:hypothetical protein
LISIFPDGKISIIQTNTTFSMQITNLSNKECSLEDARPKSVITSPGAFGCGHAGTARVLPNKRVQRLPFVWDELN